MKDDTAKVTASIDGDRVARNERGLHAAIKVRGAELPVPHFPYTGALFKSFFIGGFECSTHRRRDGKRLDLIAATGHDVNVEADYRMLAEHGIRTVRDGLSWHLIETASGRYDWSSFLPMLRAARDADAQVIWDLAHWGWPDDLDIWQPAFIDRFARFTRAVVQIVRNETSAVPFYVPVNEISFWSWAGGTVGYISPLARHRGGELKAILVRAAIAAIEAVREIDPRARIIHAEPAIHVVPRSDRRQDIDAARNYTLAQFEALDLSSGRVQPELGGRPEYVDIVGVNYYLHNQWVAGDLPIAVDCPRYRSFRELLTDFYERYRRPMLVAETGIEGDCRPAWLHLISHEVAAAQRGGVPIEGICIYPIIDYPGWEDDRHCPTGLVGFCGPDGKRTLNEVLARELALQQSRD